MSTDAPIKSRIQAYFEGVSKAEIARIAGLNDHSWLRGFPDNWNPTLKTLERIMAVIPEDWRIGDPVDLSAHGIESSPSKKTEAA